MKYLLAVTTICFCGIGTVHANKISFELRTISKAYPNLPGQPKACGTYFIASISDGQEPEISYILKGDTVTSGHVAKSQIHIEVDEKYKVPAISYRNDGIDLFISPTDLANAPCVSSQ